MDIGREVPFAFAMHHSEKLIVRSIPVFNDLLSLASALFAAWFTYGLSGECPPSIEKHARYILKAISQVSFGSS